MSEGCGDRLLAAAVKSLKPGRRRQSAESLYSLRRDVVPISKNYCCYLVSKNQFFYKTKKKIIRNIGTFLVESV